MNINPYVKCGVDMKKLQILALTTLLSSTLHYNMTYSGSSVTINGTSYHNSSGSITVINGQIVNASNQVIIENAGELETKKLSIDDVREFNASGWGDLTIEQCATCPETLTIIAGKNIMPYLQQELYNHQLHLGLRGNITILHNPSIKFHVVVKNINAISNNGAVNIQSTKTIKTDSLNIEQSGSGNINLSVDVQNINTENSGSGCIKLSGNTNNQNVHLSDSSIYDAVNLTSQTACIQNSGYSSARIHVKNKLAYACSGSGDLHYTGNPIDVSGSKSGSSTIRKI